MANAPRPRIWSWWQSVGWLIYLAIQVLIHWHDIAQAVVTRIFWINLGFAVAIAIVGGLALIGAGYTFWTFCLWFDLALKREQAKIAKRVAAYHGRLEQASTNPMRDAELDG